MKTNIIVLAPAVLGAAIQAPPSTDTNDLLPPSKGVFPPGTRVMPLDTGDDENFPAWIKKNYQSKTPAKINARDADPPVSDEDKEQAESDSVTLGPLYEPMAEGLRITGSTIEAASPRDEIPGQPDNICSRRRKNRQSCDKKAVPLDPPTESDPATEESKNTEDSGEAPTRTRIVATYPMPSEILECKPPIRESGRWPPVIDGGCAGRDPFNKGKWPFGDVDDELYDPSLEEADTEDPVKDNDGAVTEGSPAPSIVRRDSQPDHDAVADTTEASQRDPHSDDPEPILPVRFSKDKWLSPVCMKEYKFLFYTYHVMIPHGALYCAIDNHCGSGFWDNIRPHQATGWGCDRIERDSLYIHFNVPLGISDHTIADAVYRASAGHVAVFCEPGTWKDAQVRWDAGKNPPRNAFPDGRRMTDEEVAKMEEDEMLDRVVGPKLGGTP